jgi:hypothetical protein
LYVRPVQSVSSRLAGELALAPASTHMVIGGVGSGKTTELLEACHQIGQLADTQAIYVDVTRRHDVGKFVSGAVAVQVGLAFDERLQSIGVLHEDAQYLRNLANGYWGENEPDESWGMVHVPGILVSPEPRLDDDVRQALKLTKSLLDALRVQWKHVVVLLDGLDRMTDMGAFEQILEHDVKALTALGVGVVLAGPLKSLYGIARTIADRFGRVYYQPWIDLASGAEAGVFVAGVLRRRLPEDVVDQACLDTLVKASGGVLRDLLALAQLACIEAYLDGSDVVGAKEVASAIDAFGRNLMQGLRAEEIDVLRRVREKGAFVQTSEDDLALLMTRRVLEYRDNGRPRYAVHPTIEGFLGELSGS